MTQRIAALRIVRRLAKRTAAASIAIVLGSSGAWAQAGGMASFEPDATLHIPAFDMPPSSLMSEELRHAYGAALAQLAKYPPTPGPGASVAAYENYRRVFDEVVMEPALERKLKLYAVDIEDSTIGGVPVHIVTPRGGVPVENRNRVLVNLHGGGFFLGAGAGALNESVPAAALGRVKVVSVEYRMFPEASFPAASEDVAAVWRALIKEYDPRNIGVYGASAGGILTAQAVAWFQKHGLPLPGAVGVFASGLGGVHGGDSSIWGPNGLFMRPIQGQGPIPRSGYMAQARDDDPLANPIVSPEVLKRFPPTLFLTGTRAFEMSSAIRGHTELLKHGVESQIYIIEGGWHGVPGLVPETPEARDANAFVARWFDSHLGR